MVCEVTSDFELIIVTARLDRINGIHDNQEVSVTQRLLALTWPKYAVTSVDRQGVCMNAWNLHATAPDYNNFNSDLTRMKENLLQMMN